MTEVLRQVGLGDLEHELAVTRRVLERVPEEHFDWKPHEKSTSLGALATHIAGLPRLPRIVVETEELDLARGFTPPVAPESREALLQAFDSNVDALRQALAGVDREQLRTPWVMRNGERVVIDRPKAAAIRTLGISHMIHHRAQLGVYLRLLDLPVPSTYGPSADEAF